MRPDDVIDPHTGLLMPRTFRDTEKPSFEGLGQPRARADEHFSRAQQKFQQSALLSRPGRSVCRLTYHLQLPCHRRSRLRKPIA